MLKSTWIQYNVPLKNLGLLKFNFCKIERNQFPMDYCDLCDYFIMYYKYVRSNYLILNNFQWLIKTKNNKSLKYNENVFSHLKNLEVLYFCYRTIKFFPIATVLQSTLYSKMRIVVCACICNKRGYFVPLRRCKYVTTVP